MAKGEGTARSALARARLILSLDKLAITRYIYATGMKSGSHQDSAQAMQRIRVGMTGLAIVLVLIGIVSVVFSSANRERPVSAIGASNASVVANLSEGGTESVLEKNKDEPLAELGVAPSTESTEAVNAAEIARREEARKRGEAPN
ncbi:hypothetical protein [Sphingomonas sp. JC676]|uniref:hypothetical protein n=1 Tax=Sphingomonas sp. JC676 TaxID=2768065 RepID=UPI00223C3091|nr:hypothetical protein [Sphingomonas sp. JC676]